MALQYETGDKVGFSDGKTRGENLLGLYFNVARNQSSVQYSVPRGLTTIEGLSRGGGHIHPESHPKIVWRNNQQY